METEWVSATVAELQDRGVLFVEDGNHGEYRPLPDEFVEQGTPFVRPDDLKEGRVDFAGCDRINGRALARVRKGKGKAGDIAFTHRATVGRIARVGRNAPHFVANPGVTVWRSTNPCVLDPAYLYFFMQTRAFMDQVWAEAGNTDTFPYISLTQQRRLQLSFPSIAYQRAIAHVLGTLDDNIEVNRRMSETLEAMAQALFKSWFVDFDPVRAKAEGRHPGLPKPLADLFPARLIDSELGEIPDGWHVRPLINLTDYLSRGLGPSYIDSGGVCVLNQKCIRDRRVDFSKARRHNPEAKSVENRILRPLDILVNSTGKGTLGRVAQVLYLPEPTIVDSHITIIRNAETVDPWFLGMSLTGREADVESLGEGSTGQTELSRIRLGQLACLVSPSIVQQAFGHLVQPMLSRISSTQRASATLATTRDTLLPKLVSGEIRVGDLN